MAREEQSPLLDPEISDLIRRKAFRLAKQLRRPSWSSEDVEQHLKLMLLKRLAKFDEGRGTIVAMVITVIKSVGDNLLRDQSAKKRGVRPGSLNTKVGTGEGDLVALGDLVPAKPSGCDQSLVELKADVTEALASLSPDQRELVDCLGTMSIGEVARKQGLPRSTVDSRVTAIRKRFERLGLRSYLDKKE